jgi:hypothetical protein
VTAQSVPGKNGEVSEQHRTGMEVVRSGQKILELV